ncbi:hypothetical protein HELRODRAFT_183971 [Helobdella robusta]|uniref:Uncharacterized protein n=1 Tax=Helobdella robusta TaxID=6412 RepID=T1FKD7_HELRO|nr:hypothetical protein HELRODRAFT_183971 [Helobdella robusta]ESO09654.1 hypothetical protein HELRODRAFT_183971 [Helobdella robusta]
MTPLVRLVATSQKFCYRGDWSKHHELRTAACTNNKTCAIMLKTAGDEQFNTCILDYGETKQARALCFVQFSENMTFYKKVIEFHSGRKFQTIAIFMCSLEKCNDRRQYAELLKNYQSKQFELNAVGEKSKNEDANKNDNNKVMRKVLIKYYVNKDEAKFNILEVEVPKSVAANSLDGSRIDRNFYYHEDKDFGYPSIFQPVDDGEADSAVDKINPLEFMNEEYNIN